MGVPLLRVPENPTEQKCGLIILDPSFNFGDFVDSIVYTIGSFQMTAEPSTAGPKHKYVPQFGSPKFL